MSPVSQVPTRDGHTYTTMSITEVEEADICRRCRKLETCLKRKTILVSPIKFSVQIVVHSCPEFAVKTAHVRVRHRHRTDDPWEEY